MCIIATEDPAEFSLAQKQDEAKALGMKPDFRCSANRQHKRPYVLDPERPEIVIPIAISRFLRRYQRLGVQFLYDRYKGLKIPGVWEYPLKGGILGDDMGLGKTIQVTAFVSRLRRIGGLWN
jgi:SNF2 family DNA or RNA helicase